MENENKFLNMKKSIKSTGSYAANLETAPTTGEIAMVESLLAIPEKTEEISEKEIKDAIVVSNEITSIDFMMPEEERKILEQNFNLYENLEQTRKVLNIAKANKKVSEDIKTLELITKSGKVSDLLFDILTDEETIKAVKKNIKEQIKDGDVMKGYKNLATANKIILDAREEMTKRLGNTGNKKNAKIALKFTNDNGEDIQLGVEI